MSVPQVVRFSWSLALCATLAIGLTLSNVSRQQTLSAANAVDDANAVLQAVGGLGVGHIQSSLGLIGVTADAYAKEVYTAKQVEDLMNGTINGIEAVKKLLRRLQETDLSDDDEEYIDRMINVYNALQREAKTLVAFAKSRKASDAEIFDSARKAAVTKLGQLTNGAKPAAEPPALKTEN